jgi:hypothetical protein
MKQRAKRHHMQTEKKTNRKPLLLRVKFLTIAAQKRIDALRNQPHSRPMAKASDSGGLWGAFELGVWCGQAEGLLEQNTQLLHDHWDDIPEGERDALESKTVELLDAYAESC